MRRAALLLLLMAGPLLGGCIDEDLLNPMAARQPRVDPYKTSDFYADGQSMRHPPEGAVPRERFTMNPSLTAGKVTTPDGKETYVAAFPVKVTKPLLELGRKRYNITCGTCHGPAGDGDSIVGRQMGLRPPPSLLAYADKPPGYFFEVATNGFGLMASYAAEIPIKERWAIVAYIKALQLSQGYDFDRLSPEERARVEQESGQ